MPGRHRWMYHATGMPGWMRFGFSPGWVGRSPMGLGPCASYLMTGRWHSPWGFGPQGAPASDSNRPQPFYPSVSRDQQIEMLEEQADALSAQLEGIRKRIEELNSTD